MLSKRERMSEPRNEQLRKERTGSPEKGGLCEDGRRQGRALEGPVPLRSRVTPVLNHREGIFGEVSIAKCLLIALWAQRGGRNLFPTFGGCFPQLCGPLGSLSHFLKCRRPPPNPNLRKSRKAW